MPSDSTFRPEFAPQVISVTELNQTVSKLLERSIPLCWISGEVSNFTRAASGHWYFTLKDPQAQVRAVMFKSRTIASDFIPREGEKIEVRASVTLYAPRGDYQLNVENIRRAGLGNLYEAFLQLKTKLQNAGLFEPQRKRPLPRFPTCIGVVTSPQAAALRDILITLKRRAPHVQIIVYPTPVQGAGSAQKIALAVELAGSRGECDVLIVARGGGSIEDLWSFNDEALAHTIALSPVPVISGIGHETDFTIADFVADKRAPTPTAAAELAVTSREDWLQQIENQVHQMRRALRRRLDQDNQTVDSYTRRLVNPLAYIQRERIKMSTLMMQLQHQVGNAHKRATFELWQIRQRLINQSPDIPHQKNLLSNLARQLTNLTRQSLTARQHDFDHKRAQLALLSPQRTLERGYAIVQNENGQILRRPDEFTAHGMISVTVAQGTVELQIAKVQQK